MVVDLRIPLGILNGISFARIVRFKRRATKVILISGERELLTVQDAAEFGGVLDKDAGLNTLVTRIRATAFTHFACVSHNYLNLCGIQRFKGRVRHHCGEVGYFGDARRAAMGSTLIERVMETGSLVVRKLGRDRAGEMAIHRFLAAPSVTTVEIVETLAARTAAACIGRRIVVAQDTTEIDFAGREERRRGLGPAGDGVSAGFFIHPQIAIDSETGAVLGLLGARIWTRTDEIAPTSARALEDKESIRWLEGAECGAAYLAEAASVVVVADREGDIIYASFARRPAAVDLIVRAAQDRALHDGKRLFAAPAHGRSWHAPRFLSLLPAPTGAAGLPRWCCALGRS